MFQLFKPITDVQYTQRDLETYQRFERELVAERNRLNGMIDANKMMIEHLENELESMK